MNLTDCVDHALVGLDDRVRERFATDPVGVLRNELGLKVRAVDHLAQQRDDGGACDGMSFLSDGVILYAPTATSRRETFTLAHELGHWLVEQTDEVYDWLADQDDPARLLETVCDHIARRLLVPDAIIDAVVREPVRAGHVLDLYDASLASEPACAIALANRLRRLGAVVIIDDGVVTYASVQPDPSEGWPTVFPWPGHSVPNGHPIRNIPVDGSLTRRTFWQTPWGARQDYYIDAVRKRNRVIAVFSDIDLWNAETLHLDEEREFDQRPVSEIRCCGETRSVRGYPCPSCAKPFCPVCELCRCQRAAQREQLCGGTCFRKFLPNLLVNGLCEECRD